MTIVKCQLTTLKILPFRYLSPTLFPDLNISFLSLTSQNNPCHLIASKKTATKLSKIDAKSKTKTRNIFA